MTDLSTLLTFMTGIALRLAIPVLITAVAVHYLRQLDAHWQADGEKAPSKTDKPACWQLMKCSPALRKDCAGYVSPLPCWQARRTSNGYLQETCLSCKVFLKAPNPSVG